MDIRFSFDVGRSFFNVTCERLQNNLALMDPLPQYVNAPGGDGNQRVMSNCVLLQEEIARARVFDRVTKFSMLKTSAL